MHWSEIVRTNNRLYKENRWVLSLPGAGCSWAKQAEGCYMCNFKSATDKYAFGKLLPSSILANLYRLGRIKINKLRPNTLIIYNGGSFLNDREISLGSQERILKLIAKEENILKLIVESRPEYVTDEKLNFLKNILPEKELVVAIGLETKSDVIRNKAINKGFSIRTFEKALDIINKHYVKLMVYVLLKPLFISEKQAIDEAIETINYAFDAEAVEVDLEAASVIKGTKMYTYFMQGQYTPPWLWSIIEVIKQTYKLGHLHLGSFDDNPSPIAIPHNCNNCSPKFQGLADRYNELQDVAVFDNLRCECKSAWLKNLET